MVTRSRRQWILGAGALGVLGSMHLAHEAKAAGADPTLFVGNYVYAGGDRQRQEIRDAVELVVSDVFGLVRGYARRTLTKLSLPEPRIEIWMRGGELVIRRGQRPPLSAPVDGAPRTWTSPKGDDYRVAHRQRGRVVIQTFSGHGSTGKNVFQISEDGARLSIKLEANHYLLPKPLRYKQSYRRRVIRDGKTL